MKMDGLWKVLLITRNCVYISVPQEPCRMESGHCSLAHIQEKAPIRNGFMPYIMGHKLSHIYAREVR